VAGAVLPAFQKRIELFIGKLLDFKTGEIDPWQFLKALGVTLRHLPPNGSKGFELAGFEKLLAYSKAFGVKQLRTY
jgi:hypothetical protein